MVTKTIDIIKEPTELKGLLSQIGEDTEIVLTEDNHPVARLLSIKKRVAGLHTGAMRTTEDFDESLPEEYLAGSI